MNTQKPNQKTANYGQALLKTRGGWTLREILGADYDGFRSNGKKMFTQRTCDDVDDTPAPTGADSPTAKK